MALLGALVVLATGAASAQASWCRVAQPDTEPSVLQVQASVRRRERARTRVEGAPAWSYLAPHRLAFQLRHDNQLDRTGTLYDDDGWRRTTGDESQWSWRLDIEWDLARLVFNPAEIQLTRFRADLDRRTDGSVDLATRLFFERRRLIDEAEIADAKGADRATCVRLQNRIEELAARLDAMMGGEWFAPRKLVDPRAGPYTAQ